MKMRGNAGNGWRHGMTAIALSAGLACASIAGATEPGKEATVGATSMQTQRIVWKPGSAKIKGVVR